MIPAGFKILINDTVTGYTAETIDEKKGIVITDGNSEFVWIPVPDINKMIMCQQHGANEKLDVETLECQICGENTKLAGKLYATFTWQEFNSSLKSQEYALNTGIREPDVVTGSITTDSTEGTSIDALESNLEYVLENKYANTKTGASFKEQLQDEFDKMARSVAKNGGFYVGRYETSLANSNQVAQSKYGEISFDASKSEKEWYGLYVKSKTYTIESNSVKSSMIWGSQYDAIMLWMGESLAKSKIANRNTKRLTGTTEDDKINNIYDLYGNSREVTLEAYGSKDPFARTARGGSFHDDYTPGYRLEYWTSRGYSHYGTRLTLYII